MDPTKQDEFDAWIAETLTKDPALGSNLSALPMSTADKLRAALLDTAGLDTIPEPERLIAGLLHRNNTCWVVGKAGNGKSFVTLDMAGCIGTGMVWRGHEVTQGDVLYVAAEGVSGIRRRVRSWEEHWGRKMTGVVWLPAAVQAAVDETWNALITISAELDPSLIVLDTQARVTVGMEENSAQDMGLFVDRLEKLRNVTRACVLVVHHQGRNGDHARGSSAIDGAADTILQVTKDGDLVTVKTTKQKNTEEGDDITLRLMPVDTSAVLVLADGDTPAGHGAAVKFAAKWWGVFGTDWVSPTKVVDAEIVSQPTFYRHIRSLVDSGVVEKDSSRRYPVYRVPSDPNE